MPLSGARRPPVPHSRRERAAVQILVLLAVAEATFLGVPVWVALTAGACALAVRRDQVRLRRALRRLRHPARRDPWSQLAALAVAAWLAVTVLALRTPLPWLPLPWRAAAWVGDVAVGWGLVAALPGEPLPTGWPALVRRWIGAALATGAAIGIAAGWGATALRAVPVAGGAHPLPVAAAIGYGVLVAAMGTLVAAEAIVSGLSRTKDAADAGEDDWASAWLATKMVGPVDGRPPRLLGVEDARPLAGVEQRRYAVPAGRSDADLRRALPALKHALGVEYLDLIPAQPGEWCLWAAEVHPLRKAVAWSEHEHAALEEVARLVERGTLGFVAGVDVQGRLVTHDFGAGDAPHLLIAGQSGSGKSVALTSALLQMVLSYAPRDLRLTLLDPKGELQGFASLPHVDAHLTDQTPGDPHALAADALEALVGEARERQARMAAARGSPRNLLEARRGGLDVPWRLVVLEEAADYFGPVGPQARQQQQRTIAAASELARKARSAGILLVLVTQYPTRANLPPAIKQQCARLALRVKDAVASRVILDEGGAEQLFGSGHALLVRAGHVVEVRGFYVTQAERDGALGDAIARWRAPQAPALGTGGS